MHIWKNKEGKKLTGKEFISSWKGGIQAVTPMQSIKVTLVGSIIILCGILLGICTTWYYKQWWLVVILVGSLVVQGLGFIGQIQKYLTFKHIETITKEGDENDKV